MEKRITVLLADSSEDFLHLLSDAMREEGDMEVLAVTRDGQEALALTGRLRPDVLVMDLLLRQIDGIGVLRALRGRGEMPRVIVASAFFNDAVAAELAALGVSYCFPKPCLLSELTRRVRECMVGWEEKPVLPDPCEQEIETALRAAQLLPHMRGCDYLRDGLRQILSDGEMLLGVTKILYPDLARRFHTTASCVERSMRSALEAAWDRGDPALRKAYFGSRLAGNRRPSNSAFLSAAAEVIRANCRARQEQSG